MRVLFLISTLNFGGAEKQTVVDTELLAKNHNIFLVTFKQGPLFDKINSKVNFRLLKKKGYWATSLQLANYIRQNKIQVIHASLFSAMIMSVIAATITGTSVFWHIHSHEYEMPFRVKSVFRLFAHAPALKKILFVNSELKYYYQLTFKFPYAKTDILYNCSMITKHQSNDNHKAVITIGFIGRLIDIKRIDYLLDLAGYLQEKNLQRFKIMIIGDGERMAALKNYANEKNLNDHIEFLGFKSNPEEWYVDFDIFINPSQEECLSMVLIDAGMAGVPAIAFDTGGNTEIIQTGVTGYIVKDKDELFEKSLLLISNDELRKKLGAEAQEYCFEKFGADRHLEQLMKLYKENNLYD